MSRTQLPHPFLPRSDLPHPFRPGTDAALPPITIGLVNNMPEAALAATERRFRAVLAAGANGLDVRVQLFTLPSLPRNPAAGYTSTEALPLLAPDALIVTGCEPRAADLTEEPYWPALAAVFDWAESHAISLLASCLAAHAAVLHADGLMRRRLPAKCFGVFRHRVTLPHMLLRGTPARPEVAHSRWNELPEDALRALGYTILTVSEAAGVDLFVRQRRCLLVGVQGHPEYEADTLLREYRRDFGRFLAGQMPAPPRPPERYLHREAEVLLANFAREALRTRDPAVLDAFPLAAADVRSADGNAAATLFGNWLHHIAREKARLRPEAFAAREASAAAA